jgi:cytochrome P450
VDVDSPSDFGIEPRRNVLQPLFGDGIFTQEGLHWMHSRSTIRHQLKHKQYGNLEVFERTVNDLIQIIHGSGGVVDLQPLFFRMTFDITTEFLFGESVRSLVALEGSDKRRFADTFDIVQRQATEKMRRYDIRGITNRRLYRQAWKDLHRFTDQFLDENLNPDQEAQLDSTQHQLLYAIAQEAQDRTALRGQVLNLLAAGRDTTASLLSWTL